MTNPTTAEIVAALRRCATGEGDGCKSCTIKPMVNKDPYVIIGCAETIQLIAADRLEELSRWIPVTERLPEIMQNVLIVNKLGHVETAMNIGDGDWLIGGGVCNASYIRWWKPLPEPPKEE